MSKAARNARRAAGTPFFKEPKVGTPLLQRTIPLGQMAREVAARGLEAELERLHAALTTAAAPAAPAAPATPAADRKDSE